MKPALKVATYNVNGVNGRLPRLLEWLRETNHPRKPMYTYWVNEKALRERRGMRLDFLLLGAALSKRVVAAGVDSEYRGREKPSDHAALWVSLERGRNPAREPCGTQNKRARATSRRECAWASTPDGLRRSRRQCRSSLLTRRSLPAGYFRVQLYRSGSGGEGEK